MRTTPDPALSLTGHMPRNLSAVQYLSVGLAGIGLLLLVLALLSIFIGTHSVMLGVSIGLIAVGVAGYGWTLHLQPPDRHVAAPRFLHRITTRGAAGWLLAVALSGFYVCLYWFPATLAGLVTLFDPLSQAIRGRAADHWFVYGAFYTLAVVVMGVKFLQKHHRNRYQVIRTLSVMFFQLVLAFLLPAFLIMMQQPEFYFSYFWPLKFEYLFPETIGWLLESAPRLGLFMVLWGVIISFIAVPVLTYFYGKRWYCSWVCGCGALAETAGDSFRQLSDKSLHAWRIERWMVHGVLVFVILTTGLLWLNSWQAGGVLGSWSGPFARVYGFLIGAVFSGVVGTGFYPLLGNRVWCRFGCPQAAILGILQKYFSRFRITTNGGQCISCGNCSSYCEMGIDVKWYAQRGQDIVRASCVGCGICSAVCPRGVLRLENGPPSTRHHRDSRFGLSVTGDGIKLEP